MNRKKRTPSVSAAFSRRRGTESRSGACSTVGCDRLAAASVHSQPSYGMELGHAFLILVSLAFVARAGADRKCLNGKEVQESEDVNVSYCETLPCRLRRKSTVSVEMKFRPDQDVTSLTNSVQADILGVPFPFIGVDGKSVCGKIFDAKTGAKTGCPLQKGGEYVYKDEFKVLEVYPKIKVTVKWALQDQDDQSVMCFLIPAKITS